jgi:hypothetical protein
MTDEQIREEAETWYQSTGWITADRESFIRGYKKAIEWYRSQTEQSEWVDVKERLPEWMKSNNAIENTLFSAYLCGQNSILQRINGLPERTFKAWFEDNVPIPQPPKTNKNKEDK